MKKENYLQLTILFGRSITVQTKFAQVIGHSHCGQIILKNPGNEAFTVSKSSNILGFESKKNTERKRHQLEDASWQELNGNINPVDVAMLYFNVLGLGLKGLIYQTRTKSFLLLGNYNLAIDKTKPNKCQKK